MKILSRFVLDAVKKTPDSKMYFFGIAALDRFKTRLKDYPQYCQHAMQAPHFNEFPAHLKQWVEYGSQNEVPPSKPQGPVVPPSFDKSVPISVTSGTMAPITTASVQVRKLKKIFWCAILP